MIPEVTGQALPLSVDRGTPGKASGAVQPHRPVPDAEEADPSALSADPAALEDAVRKVREAFEHMASRLKIEIDPDLNRVVVKILDEQSGELIRQVPAEEMLEIAKRLDAAQGLLLTKRT